MANRNPTVRQDARYPLLVGRASFSLTVNALASGGVVSATATVSDARVGDLVLVGIRGSALTAGAVLTGFVSVDGTVTVALYNGTGGSYTLNSGSAVTGDIVVVDRASGWGGGANS